MFTGLIRQLGIISYIHKHESYLSLSVSINTDNTICIGDSVSINGICLTVITINDNNYSFHAMKETCNKTTICNWNIGDIVNTELASDNSRLDGHIVSGHVDNKATICLINENTYGFKIYNVQKEHIVKKGSIAIDGISLTVADIYYETDSSIFTICCIPYTIENTIIKTYNINKEVNIEYDLRQKCIINSNIDIPSIDQYVFSDQHAIDLACNLSELSKNIVSPNPHVGCIITCNNKIIALGYHKKPGHSHAEVEAFNYLFQRHDINDFRENKIKIYVTLEPCCHYGRTPPCTNLLVKYKDYIEKIVIGILDPDIKVSGKGMNILSEFINIELIDSKTVKNSLREYIKHRTANIPYIICKIATSLNGKMTSSNSRYITSESALMDVHKTRYNSDCIITTNKTYLIDKPRLNVRLHELEINKPICIIDRSNSCNLESCKEHFKHHNITIYNDFIECLKNCAKMGYIKVLIECGPTMFKYCCESGLIDEYHIYIDSQYIGNKELGLDFDFKMNLQLSKVEEFDTTIKLCYRN